MKHEQKMTHSGLRFNKSLTSFRFLVPSFKQQLSLRHSEADLGISHGVYV